MSVVWQQDWLSKWALYSPMKLALTEHESGREVNWLELNQKANGIAQYLMTKHGNLKGKIVAVIDEFNIEYVALFGAAQKIGFTLLPLNYRLTNPEINAILFDANPVHIFFNPDFAHLLEINEKCSMVEELQSLCETQEIPVVPVEEDHPIFIIYTSGTTGKPKGVIYTHKMLFWNSINTSISLIINSDSRTLNVMPPFHTGGWNVLLTPFLHHGAFTCLFKKFEASTVIEKLNSLRCTVFMGVPTMLSMMAAEPIFNEVELSCLDYIIVGGESMPIPLIERYATKGVAIRQGYGMTEVGPNLTSLHQDDAIRKKGSIGRANFYVKTKIIKEDGMRPKPENRVSYG